MPRVPASLTWGLREEQAADPDHSKSTYPKSEYIPQTVVMFPALGALKTSCLGTLGPYMGDDVCFRNMFASACQFVVNACIW